jgi:hypothetical protein
VEGFKINLNCIWEKKDSTYRKWTIHPVIEYGFADKILKPHISAEYKFDNYNQGIVSFKAGRQNQQYDTRDPITERNNTWNSLWNKITGFVFFKTILSPWVIERNYLMVFMLIYLPHILPESRFLSIPNIVLGEKTSCMTKISKTRSRLKGISGK